MTPGEGAHSLREHIGLLAGQQGVQLVLEAQPQRAVVDANDAVDFDPSDAVPAEVPDAEAGQEEVVAGTEPGGAPWANGQWVRSRALGLSQNGGCGASRGGYQGSEGLPSSKRMFPTVSSSINRKFTITSFFSVARARLCWWWVSILHERSTHTAPQQPRFNTNLHWKRVQSKTSQKLLYLQ